MIQQNSLMYFSVLFIDINLYFRYSEVLLRRVSAGNICFSLNQRSFVSLTAEGAIPFNAEEFSDINELRALAELIGPFGMKMLNETLMWHIASQVQEMKVSLFLIGFLFVGIIMFFVFT